ncbi:MAG: hypothetical protein IT385_17655 [Deltaproteobacteria bacterium]|nr:hypothetical protein [Deltaproteobacteria bacterium]
MLHDPSFRDRVVSEPDAALAGLDLDGVERAMLARVDARAWRLDPHRPWRVLTALIAELPVTVALVGAPQRLDRFFASERFHRAIRAREALAIAFADWLGEVATRPAERALLALEGAFVAVRRARAPSVAASPPESPPERLVTSPRVRALSLPAGTLGAWESTRARLGPNPVEALVEGFAPRTPRLGPALEHVLIERPLDREEPVAGFVQAELVELLRAAASPVARADLVARIVASEATADEAAEILDGLENEGLLAPAPEPERA